MTKIAMIMTSAGRWSGDVGGFRVGGKARNAAHMRTQIMGQIKSGRESGYTVGGGRRVTVDIPRCLCEQAEKIIKARDKMESLAPAKCPRCGFSTMVRSGSGFTTAKCMAGLKCGWSGKF